ncbi:MAG: polysaccharide biosynthesis/export family protein [Acidobacteriaceae bacterium]
MTRGKEMLVRLSQFAVAAVTVSLTCCLLHAQTQPAVAYVGGFNSPFSTPEPSVGTSFQTKSGDTALVRPETRITPGVDAHYRIGADDVLTVNVWHEPEVSRNVPVRPDGKISLPLVGDVQAAGLTPTELQNELEARFSKFLTDPDVSVIVAEIRSQRINVLGQVLRPGTYALIPPMNVIDAVATAGGLREFAKPNKIYVLRTLPTGQMERIKVQYNNLLKGKRGSEDVLLQTRDTVVVP